MVILPEEQRVDGAVRPVPHIPDMPTPGATGQALVGPSAAHHVEKLVNRNKDIAKVGSTAHSMASTSSTLVAA